MGLDYLRLDHMGIYFRPNGFKIEVPKGYRPTSCCEEGGKSPYRRVTSTSKFSVHKRSIILDTKLSTIVIFVIIHGFGMK